MSTGLPVSKSQNIGKAQRMLNAVTATYCGLRPWKSVRRAHQHVAKMPRAEAMHSAKIVSPLVPNGGLCVVM